jgi:hypothetical protein
MIFPLRKFYATESPRFHQASAQTRTQRVAECAYAAAAQLRHDYGVIGPPLFNNFLVNLGIRKRGLCFQWAEDLLVQLDALKLRTLQVHWAEARAGSLREHNGVVVTAKGQPFREGIILDCWRHSGHLFWSLLATDHSPDLRIYGTQTLGLCATQVCDLCSLQTATTVDPQPEGGYYASVAFQFQPARSALSANDNCSRSLTSSTFHLPSTFSR